jgi:hypothetical protein
MNITETGLVLAKIQAFDNRNVDDPTAIAWQEILEPYAAQDCLDAVAGYFKSNTGWIMPAHIVDRVREIEEARVRALGYTPYLAPADEDAAMASGQWSAAMRRLHRAVAKGELGREQYQAYLSGDLRLESVLAKELTK